VFADVRQRLPFCQQATDSPPPLEHDTHYKIVTSEIFCCKEQRETIPAAMRIDKGFPIMSRFASKFAAWSFSRDPRILILALIVCTTLARRSDAIVQPWQLSISEKEGELVHAGDMTWGNWLMWDTAYERMIDRNMPYLELKNNSANPITELHLTIGDSRFNFAPVTGSALTALGSSTPGFTLNSSTSMGGNQLDVTFGSGLGSGSTIRFKIKIGVDSGFASQYASQFGSSLPDFRTVLFDNINQPDVYGPDPLVVPPGSEDNALAFVLFNPGGPSTKVVFPDLPIPLDHFFFNNLLRHYTDTDMLTLSTIGGNPIPEPASIGLAMLGIAGMLLGRRSRSRRSAV
jgi:hypothetical protein